MDESTGAGDNADLNPGYEEQTRTVVWSPQPGPQAEAMVATWCPELLYGGAMGGGKTAYLLADYAQDLERYKGHWQGILFRRTYRELEDAIAKSKTFYPQLGGTWFSTDHEWRWKSGAKLKMRYLERFQDWQAYQGHEYCLAITEPILLADGTSKPVGDVAVGDLVATLEGPRRVIKIFTPELQPVCRAVTAYGSQIQSVDHAILSAYGWRSYASARDNDSKGFAGQYQGGESLQPWDTSVALVRSLHKRRAHRDISKAKLYRKLYKRWRSLHAICRATLQRFSKTQNYLAQAQRFYSLVLRCISRLFLGDEDARVSPARLATPNYPTDCRDEYRFCDALLRRVIRNDRSTSQPAADAEGRSRVYLRVGALDNTPKHNLAGLSDYQHPYDGSVRNVSVDCVLGACRITPLNEKRLVVHITIEDNCHYISANSRLVNRNCWQGWDELTQWPDSKAYLAMMTRLRSPVPIPTKRIRASANPGGHGHTWVKQRFVDPAPLGYTPIADKDTGLHRMFIPAKVFDNKILINADPDYVKRIKLLDDPILIRAWLDGDWSLPVGAMFPQVRADRHILPPHRPSEHLFKMRGFDWGGFSPFAVLWAYISDGEPFKDITGVTRRVPEGSIVIYREWYGCKPDKTDEGVQMPNDQIARGIVERSPENQTWITVTDSLPFQGRGMKKMEEEFSDLGVPLTRGDTSREVGWQQVRSRLIGVESPNGGTIPTLYITSDCPHTFRTLSSLQRDILKLEDAESGGEDHLPDVVRLICMTRPLIRHANKQTSGIDVSTPTFDDVLEKHLQNYRANNNDY